METTLHAIHSITRTCGYPRLEIAWHTAIQQLPILRTRIVQTSTGLHQVIIKGSVIHTDEVSLASQPPMELGKTLNRIVLDQEQKVLVWVSHHATYDGVSTPLVLNLVDQAYHQRPTDSISIPDYRIFIKYMMQLSLVASHSFWASQLADANPEPFPPISSSASSRVNTSARLQANATTALATPPTPALIRAAWALVLATYTSSDDIVFGTILSGRNAPVHGIDHMAGPVIATVPIRVRISRDDKVRSFLDTVQNQSLDMISHEHFGLQNIRRISSEARRASAFHNLLVIHPAKEKISSSQDHSSFLKTDSSFSSFNMNTYALVFEVQILQAGYSLEVSYDQSIIKETQMQRILRQFNHVIAQLFEHRSQASLTVGNMETISCADREEIWQWNDTIPDTAKDSLRHLIQQRARLTPDAEAIVSWDGNMTYRELDRASSALSKDIFSRDSSVGTFVAICFEKSLWTPVAMLAVLKAGKAFAFLDPTYPVERLRQVTSILNPQMAISSQNNQDICRKLVPKTIVLGPSILAGIKYSVSPPDVVVRPTDPICAIFTSGTTGKPKAAILSHRSYVSSNLQHPQVLSLSSNARMLQFSSCSFDAMIFEVMTVLMVGGCVCIPDEKYRNIDIDMEISRMNVNWSLLTPSFASLLSPQRVPSLKDLVLIGEAANVQLIQRWSKKLRLHNGYGPSECSIFSTIKTNLDNSTSPTNIGQATSGATWIVDSNSVDRLIPIGAPGELLLEGPNIGEGYINDPEQTQAVILTRAPKWFQRENKGSAPSKFYRTGDIVKYAEDGSISIVGRKDTQAKIRG